MSGRALRRAAALVVATGSIVAASCAPDPVPAPPTRLALTTELTWCGGVIPPPGEPWCHTRVTATTVDVMSDPVTVVGTVVTGADGLGTVDLPAGRYRLVVRDVPVYMTCESPIVTLVAEQTTAASLECTVMAP